jgi:hypothetical protein
MEEGMHKLNRKYSTMKATAPKVTAHKEPKTVQVKVLIPYLIILIFAALIGGIILGYFAGIDLHSDARATVLSEITATARTSK